MVYRLNKESKCIRLLDRQMVIIIPHFKYIEIIKIKSTCEMQLQCTRINEISILTEMNINTMI